MPGAFFCCQWKRHTVLALEGGDGKFGNGNGKNQNGKQIRGK
jgi:hypothetical protein